MQTILLIDDDPDILDCLSSILTRNHYHVVSASDAARAWSLVDETGAGIDLAIVDHHLPGMNGLELSRLIQKALPQLPLVIMTGDSGLECVRPAGPPHIARYLFKPVRMHGLLQLVKELLGQGLSAEKAPGPHGSVKPSAVPILLGPGGSEA